MAFAAYLHGLKKGERLSEHVERIVAAHRVALVLVALNMGAAVALPFAVSYAYGWHTLYMMGVFRELELADAIDPGAIHAHLETGAGEDGTALDAAQLLVRRHGDDLRLLGRAFGLVMFLLSLVSGLLLFRSMRLVQAAATASEPGDRDGVESL